MIISPATATPAAAAQSSVASGVSKSDQISVRFEPGGPPSGPLDRVGGGVMDKLRQYEANRAERTKSVQNVTGGPASAFEAARAELTAGPASLGAAEKSASGPAGGAVYQDAVSAMTRGFDYAIETQLIVKTGSQFSTSASSLMRGQ